MRRPRAGLARPVLLRFSSLMIGGLATLVILEIVVRVFLPETTWRLRDATADWQVDARLGWVQKPNLDVDTPTEHGWRVRFRTNEDGVTPHTATRARPSGVLRILLVGDSTIVGRNVPQDKTVNVQLEAWLDAHGVKSDVVNAGVEGYSSDQALLRLEALLPLYQPDLAVYAFCNNDLQDNAAARVMGFAKPRFRVTGEGDLELMPPESSGQTHEIRFAHGLRSLLQHWALYRSLQPRLFALRARWMTWDGQDALAQDVEQYYHPEEIDGAEWRLLGAILRRMDVVSAKRGARFFFYAHPSLAEVWEPFIRSTERRLRLPPGVYDRRALEKRLAAVARNQSVSFCQMVECFAGRQERGPFHLLPRDPHCNPAGYQLTAERLGQWLMESGMARGGHR